MIEVPPEVFDSPETRRALGQNDWATVLRVIIDRSDVSQTKIAAVTGLSQSYVSRLVSGRSTEPSIRTVRMLCDGLGIPRSMAGLLDKNGQAHTKRRQILSSALGVSALTMMGTGNGHITIDVAEDDELLTVPSVTYRRLEQRLPSRALIAPVSAHLTLVRQVVARKPQARKLNTVISEAAGLAAWLFVDMDDRASARRHYQLAVRAAQQSGHPLLPAYMIGSLSHFAAISGDGVQGLREVRNARNQLPRSAPLIASVWLDAIEAVTLAVQGDRRAMALLKRAEQRLPAANSEEPVWPWLFRFDERKFAGYRATVAARLMMLEEAADALTLARQAVSAPKQRAVLGVEQARLEAATGNLEKACAMATAAFDTGRSYGSNRVLQAVIDFRNSLGVQHSNVTGKLDQQLDSLYREDR